jgi:hypoxanthine phosphoribosyltransferase
MKALFNTQTIEKRIQEIASQIVDRHKHDQISPVFICVLNGGFMFYTKLVERVCLIDPECDFIKVKSYEGQERGNLEIQLHSSVDVKNKHVYIVDDIYDSGVTMNSLKDYYLSQQASNVTMVTMIKRSINEMDMPSDSIYGFEIQDEWVVGFGLDDESGKQRSMPFILAV